MHKDHGNIGLLIVDDDDDFRSTIVRRFKRRGFQVEEASCADDALSLAERFQFDVAVVDMKMPGMSGLELLDQFQSSQFEGEFIMLTGQATVESAVEAMKLGAFDYLQKPFPLADLELIIHKAYEHHKLQKENKQLKAVLELNQPPGEMVGQSPAIKDVFKLIQRVGPTDKAVLIQGESGTGKELVARALHKASPRSEKPLVVVNCAALPEPLLESELFGHEKGSFTGAIGAKQGLFELADGGTLMIDEIGEMPGSIQAKLLRVLEDGSMRRVGSLKERRVDVRLLAATNRNIGEEVKQGRFREDLYYRINVMSLELPPLRKRGDDVRLLVERFVGPGWIVEPAAMEAMMHYHWPGNVRQLINAIDRAKILAEDQTIHLFDLPSEATRPEATGTPSNDNGNAALATIERAHIIQVLQGQRGNKSRAARALGINRRSLYRLIEKFQICADEISVEFR